MSLPKSKVTTQGQISVPAEVRRKLGIAPGSVLEWDANDESAVVRKIGKYTFDDIHQVLFANRPKQHHTLEELKQAIGKHLSEKHARRRY
jgi:AbrB family looped-hinge helix DNA binding protein